MHKPMQRGKLGYIQLLAHIKQKPQSIEQIQADGILSSQASRVMWGLHKCGVLHIVAWAKFSGRYGHYRPVFAYGPGKDAPEPEFNADGHRRYRRARRCTAALKSEMMILCDLIKYLSEVPCTVRDAAEWAGTSTTTIGRVIRALFEAGLIYVQDWEDVGKRRVTHAAVYMAGNGRSKPKPKRFTKRENNERYRDRERAMQIHSAMVAFAANVGQARQEA